MVGLPYPNMKSAELEEKMKYLDKAVVRHPHTHSPTHPHTHMRRHMPYIHRYAMIDRNSSSDKPPLQFSMLFIPHIMLHTFIVYIQ